jgi:elongation factor Ts
MEITAKDVMDLRTKTGVGMMDCKEALREACGDIEKAVKILREKGIAQATKRSGRETKNGYIATYVHPGSRLAVMVEINCETDFVARNEDFQAFAKNVAMQVAAASPVSVSEQDVDPEILAKEREIYRQQALNEGKKPEFTEKIVEGRVNKYLQENCLMNQVYIKDPSQKTKINDLLADLIAKIGENIKVNRFCRFEVGV